MARKVTITKTLQRAVRESGLSLYRIALDTGLNEDALSRFVRGQTSMRLDLADRLAARLDVECRRTRRPKNGR